MSNLPFAIKIGGQAGQGIKSAGQNLAKIATRSGYQVHTYTEFPSLIKGGHNVTQILISPEEVLAPLKKTDLLIALNQDTINRHADALPTGGGVIFDADKKLDTGRCRPDVTLIGVRLSKIAGEAGGGELMVNTVAVGAAAAVLGADLAVVKELIKSEYEGKGEEVVGQNHKAVEAGYNTVVEKYADKRSTVLKKMDSPTARMLIDGAEAVALGAIAGGVQFAAIYPMSPISNIITVLAKYQEQYGFIYKQPEDEIAAINMAVGAGFAGARAMTATSGGGFCLMAEGLGLAAMTETPVVVIEGMRPGPATGLPTWTGQGDLQFILHAHQGEFPRIVLAAGDIKEAFEMTRGAFNLSEKYQTPVIVIVDKNLMDDDQSYVLWDNSAYQVTRGKVTTDFDTNYARYAPSDDGVSMRALPGSGNFYIANSDEHNPQGLSTEEAAEVVNQYDKRMAKLTSCEREDMQGPQFYGPEEAETTIVSWGSNRGSILTALKDFPNVNYMHITWMSPFPVEAVKARLARAKHIVNIESNYTGQLAALIAEKTGVVIGDKLLKYDGRPIYPEEVADKLTSVLKGGR